MKNIAVFCDGTLQNLSQRFPTNVTRLARAVVPTADGGTDGSCSRSCVAARATWTPRTSPQTLPSSRPTRHDGVPADISRGDVEAYRRNRGAGSR